MLALLLLLPAAAARILHLPDDPDSFPKYKVDFLNHLPLPDAVAQQWLAHGLRGGIREFMDQPWDGSWHPPALGDGEHEQVTFGVADEDVSLASTPDASDDYSFEHLKMGPDHHPPPDDEPDDEPTPAHSWSLLLPLEGMCLYHRQTWFTYSYCHGRDGEIRQFRELIQARPLSTGAHRPEEDPDASGNCLWEAYTLGRAPPAPEPGADLTVAQQNALAANLELARTAGSRYLVQRWGDGTLCDKTGKPREVEVQFHCSMATTDTIAFVKESKTCAYVLVVHTPRLCGEPGFMTKDAGEQAAISCREIIAGELPDRSDAAFLPGADHPLQKPRRKPVLPLPAPAPNPLKDGAGKSSAEGDAKADDVLRKVLGAIKDMQWGQASDIEMVEDDNGNLVLQFYEEVPLDGEGGGDFEIEIIDLDAQEGAVPADAAAAAVRDRLAALLREANQKNIKGAASAEKNKDKKKEKQQWG
ncbi:PRKCSH domain-containing protein [Mycena sanguinolenta]|uniref:Protein OS-9 homolog n=1 Tax=Mycena sanguinolenta TaxID=230812 RepID=A0A8H6YLH8_9AGAR|nr:PRKCSH domain-containing protein [Mycena sanguinolenta]